MILREVNRVREGQKNVPKLRFKGYEDAWEQRRLEEIFLKIRNAFVGTSTPYYVEKNQGGHFYIESNNVKHGKINHDTEVFINEEFYQNQKDKWLKTGDIVMVQSGHVGHSAVIPEYLNNSAAHALIMFQEYKIETNPYFINFQFQTESVRNKIDSITTGNTIKHILASDMKLFSISYTQKKEADKLGDFFISLDNLITLHQRKYDALKAMKKTLLSKMFPKDGEDIPEIRFKGFTDAWEQRKLGEVKDVRDGTHDSPKYISSGYPLVTSKNLTENGLDYSDISYISEDDFLDINQRSKVEIGDIIFGMIGTIGNPVMVTSEGFAIKNVALLKNNGIIKNSFLIHLLKSPIFTKYVNLENAGGTQKFLGLTQIRNFECLIPNEEEQVILGEFFNDVDHLITLHQRKLEELKNMKKTLLQQMFV